MMSFDAEALFKLEIPVVRCEYSADHCILYALGVGIGTAPFFENELNFVNEANLKALPFMALTLGTSDSWLLRLPTGIDLNAMVHGDQKLVMHYELPVAGVMDRSARITGIRDNGIGKGAIVEVEEWLTDARSGQRLATMNFALFCRRDGGCGSMGETRTRPTPVPQRPADEIFGLSPSPQQALIYRLSGDRNPLHISPAYAEKAGFDKPILHGLASYGNVGRILLQTVCNGKSARFTEQYARFSAPLYPGEPLSLKIWRGIDETHFQLLASDRNVVALDNGIFRYTTPPFQAHRSSASSVPILSKST